MNQAWKVGMTLAGILTLIVLIILGISGALNLASVCIMGYVFLLLTVFFTVAYILSRIIGNVEKGIWRWMNK